MKAPPIDNWGVMLRYEDANGKWHRISDETHAKILAAMGVDGEKAKRGNIEHRTSNIEHPTKVRPGTHAGLLHEPGWGRPVPTLPAPVDWERRGRAVPAPAHPDAVQVVRARSAFTLPAPAELILEDGTQLTVERTLPRDLPCGNHQIRYLKNEFAGRLIVSPGQCHLPPDLRAWGWALQLYALRSKKSWGMGDLGDLRQFAEWSRRHLKSDFLLVNPLGAATPVLPQQSSPYYPSSRRYRNPLYLRIEDVPGAGAAGLALEKLAAAGAELNQKRFIHRDPIFRLKMMALGKIWVRFRTEPAFEKFRAEQGPGLANFAVFCALAEHYGRGWKSWPAAYRNPDSPAVKKFASQNARRVRFHEWLQWLLDRQLARAGSATQLMQDLPVGFDPEGADAWAWQELLANDVTIGAPPDQFNTQGQDWGLPPFVPHRLRAAGYEPFRQTVRAMLRHAGGLRIDHVMGLFRLFWVPQNAGPAQGAYVRYRADELLAILAVESQRARAVIVGEDLGTVEPGVRDVLGRHKILSYRLLWFEKEPPRQFPRTALAAVTTHDLFTIAGLWSGSDLEEQIKLCLNPNVEGAQTIVHTLQKRLGVKKTAPVKDVIPRTYRLLAKAPSQMLTATLDDALAVKERPNMPGTTRWPNWSIGLPATLEQIRRHPGPRKIAAALKRR